MIKIFSSENWYFTIINYIGLFKAFSGGRSRYENNTKQYHTVPTRVRKGRVGTDNDKTRGRSEHIVWYLVLKIERKEYHTILSDSHTLPVDDSVGYFSKHRQEPAIQYAQTKVIKCITKGSIPCCSVYFQHCIYRQQTLSWPYMMGTTSCFWVMTRSCYTVKHNKLVVGLLISISTNESSEAGIQFFWHSRENFPLKELPTFRMSFHIPVPEMPDSIKFQ